MKKWNISHFSLSEKSSDGGSCAVSTFHCNKRTVNPVHLSLIEPFREGRSQVFTMSLNQYKACIRVDCSFFFYIYNESQLFICICYGNFSDFVPSTSQVYLNLKILEILQRIIRSFDYKSSSKQLTKTIFLKKKALTKIIFEPEKPKNIYNK